MSIDRIGKGGAPAPPEALTPKEGASRGAPVGAPFEARRDAPVAPSGVDAVKASPALDGVKNGTLDARGYVDAKVEEATAHMTHLSASQREAVQSVVRAQLLADPHLAALVEQATGMPNPKDDV